MIVIQYSVSIKIHILICISINFLSCIISINKQSFLYMCMENTEKNVFSVWRTQKRMFIDGEYPSALSLS
jgi:hypothetical protein